MSKCTIPIIWQHIVYTFEIKKNSVCISNIFIICNLLNKGSVWAYNSDFVNTRIILFFIKWSLVRLVVHVFNTPCSNTINKMRFDQCIVNGHERLSIQECLARTSIHIPFAIVLHI